MAVMFWPISSCSSRQAFAGVFFGVDQLFGQRPSRRQLRFQPLAIVMQVLRQVLLAADGNASPMPSSA